MVTAFWRVCRERLASWESVTAEFSDVDVNRVVRILSALLQLPFHCEETEVAALVMADTSGRHTARRFAMMQIHLQPGSTQVHWLPCSIMWLLLDRL